MDEVFAERKRAVELSGEGWSQAAIADELGRSREWVRKWLGRYRASGLGGLGDRSRRPLSHPTQLPEGIVAEVLRARDVLAGHPFANQGPNAIYAFLERDGTIDQTIVVTWAELDIG